MRLFLAPMTEIELLNAAKLISIEERSDARGQRGEAPRPIPQISLKPYRSLLTLAERSGLRLAPEPAITLLLQSQLASVSTRFIVGVVEGTEID